MRDQHSIHPGAAGTDPAERGVVIRPVAPEDAAGLQALFASLDLDDRHQRFFAAYHPDLAFCTELATVAGRGGARLVAALAGPVGSSGLLGEAGYSMLPNGDGELTVTVAAPWRVWLAPVLIDAVLAVAAEAGVPNLEADVLCTNRHLLAVLRERSSVVMEHTGWRAARLLVGTDGRVPIWPGGSRRPRLLVERSGARWPDEAEARSLGYDVVTCTGPHDDGSACPELVGERCPLVAEADAIVVSPRGDEDHWQVLVASHARSHPSTPVLVERHPVPSTEEVP